jgi:hypothetical protein
MLTAGEKNASGNLPQQVSKAQAQNQIETPGSRLRG